MYVNKCIKCGKEFETKNPKRVICPDCLYLNNRSDVDNNSSQENSNEKLQSYSSENISYGGYSQDSYQRSNYDKNDRAQGGYQQRQYNSYSAGQGYDRPQQGYNNRNNGYNGYNNRERDNRGSYNRGSYSPQGGYNNRNGYDRPQGGYNRRPQNSNGRYQDGNGAFKPRFNNNRPQQRRPQAPRPMNKQPKALLISKEQLETIEALYKTMLPLPNPDAHEVIGAKIELEPRKVFFGINLVRQKMMLPKLPYPKRKLALSEDQLTAIKSLYEPLLPLPPIGCHKIIAAQLRIEEWRVHVGIGLIRKQMGVERWIQDRDDAPEEFRKIKSEVAEVKVEESVEEKPKRGRKSTKKVEPAEVAEVTEAETLDVEEKPKRGRKSAKKVESDEAVLEEVEEKPKKTRTRKVKKDDSEADE